jgi:AraC-like DNA-binding protein
MDCKQQEFEWTRASQLAALRDVQCVDVSVDCGCRRIKVKAVNLKAVLRQIDDYARDAGECYASQQTLADKTGLSPKTTQRVLKALTELSLVTCELKRNPHGVVTNHYRIVWSELQLLIAKAAGADSAPRRHGGTEKTQSENCQSASPCLRVFVVNSIDVAEEISGTDRSPEPTVRSPGPTDRSRVTYKAHLNAMKRKPPPTSSSLFDPPAIPSARDPQWQEVEEAVAAQGVEDWHGAVTAVRKRGVVPEKVLLIVGHFARHKAEQQWGPGVLYRRLMNTTRDCVVGDHWPVVGKPVGTGDRVASVQPGCLTTASKSFRGDAEDSQVLKARVAAAREKQLHDQTALALLESELGEVLDVLGDDARHALAERALAGNLMLLRMYHKHGCAKLGMVREAMLEKLREERNTESGERK